MQCEQCELSVFRAAFQVDSVERAVQLAKCRVSILQSKKRKSMECKVGGLDNKVHSVNRKV